MTVNPNCHANCYSDLRKSFFQYDDRAPAPRVPRAGGWHCPLRLFDLWQKLTGGPACICCGGLACALWAAKPWNLFQSRATAIAFRLLGRSPKVHSLRDMRTHYGVPVIGSTDVNQPGNASTQIQAWQPDLVISIYLNQLIKRALIDLPPQGVINIHPALLPRHRGLFPYFWVIAAGEKETGVTIHWVDEKFDTGQLLLQEKITVEPTDTIISLSYKSSMVGADMLVKASQSHCCRQPTAYSPGQQRGQLSLLAQTRRSTPLSRPGGSIRHNF